MELGKSGDLPLLELSTDTFWGTGTWANFLPVALSVGFPSFLPEHESYNDGS